MRATRHTDWLSYLFQFRSVVPVGGGSDSVGHENNAATDALSYAAQGAYRGETASRYEADRVVEPIWGIEQEWVRRWAASLPSGYVVADIPTGTGRFLGYFHEHGLRAIAVDISADMLAEVRKRHGEKGGWLKLVRADAAHLELSDQSVDRVLCWRLFHLLPLPAMANVLREFRRICRGPIVVEVMSVHPDSVKKRIVDVAKCWIRRVAPRTRRKSSVSESTPWAHIPSFTHAERDIRRVVADAGLRIDRSEHLGVYRGLPVIILHLLSK